MGGGIKLGLDPAKNSGYTTWKNVPGLNYVLRISEKNSDGTSTIISQTIINNDNYVKIDPLIFTIPNTAYQILAVNNSGKVVHSTDEVLSLPVGGGGLGWEYGCTISCNGRSYAWQLTEKKERISEGPIDQNTGEVTYNLGNNQLQAAPTHVYRNYETGEYIPYWQAISSETWQQISNGHPYKLNSATAGIPLYLKVNIANSGLVGPFYTSSGSSIFTGWLVEKKMDQFDHYNGTETRETANLNSICSSNANTFNLHLAAFNNHNDVETPLYPSVFTNEITENLECIRAFTDVVVDPEDPYNPEEAQLEKWYEFLDDIWDEIRNRLQRSGANNTSNITNWNQLLAHVNPIFDVKNIENKGVKTIIISSIFDDKVSASISVNQENGQLNVISNTDEIEKGIYKVMIFTDDSNIIIPTVLEIENDFVTPIDKDFFELDIAPNPISNNKVAFSILANKQSNVFLKLHNLNGDVLYSESILMNENSTTDRLIDIDETETTYNQVRISLLFPDGSVLQKTAMTLEN